MSTDILTGKGREAFIRLSAVVGLTDAAKIVADLRAELAHPAVVSEGQAVAWIARGTLDRIANELHGNKEIHATLRRAELINDSDVPLYTSPATLCVDHKILGLLREARATLEMWKDVAPAVSLCTDIDKALSRPAAPAPEAPTRTQLSMDVVFGLDDNGKPVLNNAAPTAAQAPEAEPSDITGPLTDEQRAHARALYANFHHLGPSMDNADHIIRYAAVSGYVNGKKDFGPQPRRPASDEEVRTWAERYDIENRLGHQARSAFEEAETLFMTFDAATTQPKTAPVAEAPTEPTWESIRFPWAAYPIGTKARESWAAGGFWIKTERGWKWHLGATFPRPGAADEVLAAPAILRHFGLPENDWEALSLIQAAQASPAKPDLSGLTADDIGKIAQRLINEKPAGDSSDEEFLNGRAYGIGSLHAELLTWIERAVITDEPAADKGATS